MNLNNDFTENHLKTRKAVLFGKNRFLSEVTGVSEVFNQGIQMASWSALNTKLGVIYRKLRDLRLEQQKLQSEQPLHRYLSKRPLSARCFWLCAFLGFICVESSSWVNAAWFAKETLGEDHFVGPLTMAMPIVLAPWILKFFSDKYIEHEAKIRKVLFLVFAASAIGWFSQFGSRFAYVDTAPTTFSTDWNASSAAPSQKTPPVSYTAYLAFQLVLECLGSYVFVQKMSKYSGPQVDPKFEKIQEALEKVNWEMETLEAQEALVAFHRNRLRPDGIRNWYTPASNTVDDQTH